MATSTDASARPPSRARDDSGELDFYGVFRTLRSNAVLIAASALVLGLVVFGVSFLFEPRYEATVVMMPTQESELTGALSALSPTISGLVSAAGLGVAQRSKEREGLAILRSRAFSREFFARQDALKAIFPGLWDADSQTWDTRDGKPPSLNAAYERFDKKIRTVRRNSETSLVELSIRLPDRHLAEQWANGLAAQVNADMRARAIDQAQKSLSFLRRELGKTDVVSIRESIYSLIESQTREIMLANVSEEYGFRIIDPAVVADEGAYVFPNHILLALLGVVTGGLIGSAIAIGRRRPG